MNLSSRTVANAIAVVVFASIINVVSSSDATAGDDHFADRVIAYEQGAGGNPDYANPLTTLGRPERFTGEGLFPSVVSPFSPPFGLDEIVSIGSGGFLTVAFDTPVVDDPSNPFGIDLIIFANTAFIDSNYPNGIVGGVFGDDGGTIEVSADGNRWFTIAGQPADDLFPTLGFLDAGPYDDTRGVVPSRFTRPVNPSLTLNDFMGLSHAEVLALYDGSGGGSGVDIGSTGLSEISFVRISHAGDGAIEIDAFADVLPVPGPAGAAVMLLFMCATRSRRRESGQ
ncbi:MAG: hypothetical protein ACR2GY_04780 [Phycisphaerales bacterium]